MNASRWCSVGVVSILAASLFSCGKPSAVVNQSDVSEAQAQTQIELRLAKTQEVRTQVIALRDAIRPIESALHDFGKAVDLRVDERPGSALAGLLDRLEQVLREAASGIVETHSDGSWRLERPSPLAVAGDSRTNGSVCGGSRVRLSGLKNTDGELISIGLSDCAQPTVFETLATLLIRVDGNRDISITASTFEGVHREQVDLNSMDLCNLHIGAHQYVNFKCRPMSVVSGETTVGVERFDYHTDAQGTHAAVHASLKHAAHGPLGVADLVIEPNVPAEVRVCTRGQPCGS